MANGTFSLRVPDSNEFPVVLKLSNELYKRDGRRFQVGGISESQLNENLRKKRKAARYEKWKIQQEEKKLH
jgi:hypothetical protein